MKVDEILDRFMEWRTLGSGEIVLGDLNKEQAKLALKEYFLGLRPEKRELKTPDGKERGYWATMGFNEYHDQITKAIEEGMR